MNETAQGHTDAERRARLPAVLGSYADAIERQRVFVIDSDFLPVLRRAVAALSEPPGSFDILAAPGTTVTVVNDTHDIARLETAKAEWRFAHMVRSEDVPWLLEIAASVRHVRFSQADVDELLDLAKCWDEEAEWSDQLGKGNSAYRAEMTDKGVWGGNAKSCRRRAEVARSLADRIDRLLPDETP